uniref:RING-type E3 ubiquitin transferase BRCA1 n=1 Tax=Strigamia maritima TaxID=126957 RepID=T1JA44_STRMM
MLFENALKEISSALHTNIQCSFCMKTLSDPVSTLCDHQFCRKCILDFLKKTTQHKCPRCDATIAIKHLTTDKCFSEISNLVNILAKEMDTEIRTKAGCSTGKRFDYVVPQPVSVAPKINHSTATSHAEDTINLPSTSLGTRNSNARRLIQPSRRSHSGIPHKLNDNHNTLYENNERGTLLTQLDREYDLNSTTRFSPAETRIGFNNKLFHYIVSEDLTGQKEVDEGLVAAVTPENSSISSGEVGEENEQLFKPGGTNMSYGTKVQTWLRGMENNPKTDASSVLINEKDSSLEEEPKSESRNVQLQTTKRKCGIIRPLAVCETTTAEAVDPYDFIPSQRTVPVKKRRGRPRGKSGRLVKSGKFRNIQKNRGPKYVPIEKAEAYDNVQPIDSSQSEDEEDLYRLFLTPRITEAELNEQTGKLRKSTSRIAIKSTKRKSAEDRREYENEIKAMADEIEDVEKHDLTVMRSKRRKIDIMNVETVLESRSNAKTIDACDDLTNFDFVGAGTLRAPSAVQHMRCSFSPDSSDDGLPAAFGLSSIVGSPIMVLNKDGPGVENDICVHESENSVSKSHENNNLEEIGQVACTTKDTLANVMIVNNCTPSKSSTSKMASRDETPSKMASRDETPSKMPSRDETPSKMPSPDENQRVKTSKRRNIFCSFMLNSPVKTTSMKTNPLESVIEISDATTSAKIDVPNKTITRINTPIKITTGIDTSNKTAPWIETVCSDKELQNISVCRMCGIPSLSVVSLGVQTDFQFSSTDVIMYPSFRVPVDRPNAESCEEKINSVSNRGNNDSDKLVVDDDHRQSVINESITSAGPSFIVGSVQTPPSKPLIFENCLDPVEDNVIESEREIDLISNRSLSPMNDSLTTQPMDIDQLYENQSANRSKRKRSRDYANETFEVEYNNELERDDSIDEDIFIEASDNQNKLPSHQTSTPKSESEESVIHRPLLKANTSRRLEDSDESDHKKYSRNIFDTLDRNLYSLSKTQDSMDHEDDNSFLQQSPPPRETPNVKPKSKTRRGLANISNIYEEFPIRKENVSPAKLSDSVINVRSGMLYGGGSPKPHGPKSKTRRNLSEYLEGQTESMSQDMILPTPNSKTGAGRSFTSISELNEKESEGRLRKVDDSGYGSTKRDVSAKRSLSVLLDKQVIQEGDYVFGSRVDVEEKEESVFVVEENVKECSAESHESKVEKLRKKHRSFLELPDEINVVDCEMEKNRQYTPSEKRDTPVEKRDTPIEKRDTPIEKRDTPIEKRDMPIEKRASPIEKRPTPIEKSTTTIEKSGTPIEKNTTTIEKSGTPIEKSGTTIEKSGTPIEKSGTPIEKSDMTIEKSGTTIEKSGTTIEKSGTTIEKSGTSIEKSGTLIEKSGTPIEKRGAQTEKRSKQKSTVDAITDSELLNIDLDIYDIGAQEEEQEQMTTNNSTQRKLDNLNNQQNLSELSLTPAKVIREVSAREERQHSVLEPLLGTSRLQDTNQTARREIQITNFRRWENVIEEPVEEDGKLSFVASGLNAQEMKQVQDLARKIDADFRLKFSYDTSHVIVKTSRDFIANRTLKYLQGIASKCWLVSIDWVTDSLRVGRLHNEERYEVVGDRIQGNHCGPKRSRVSKELLFSKYEICCVGEFLEITKDDLIKLATSCGARSVYSATMFSYTPGIIQLLLLQSVERNRAIQDMCDKYEVIAASRDWLLDSISQYTILPMKTYPHLNPSIPPHS